MSLFTDKVIGYFSSGKQRMTGCFINAPLRIMHNWVNSLKVVEYWLQVLKIRSRRWKFYINSLKTYLALF
jgi:hypothetical protein